MGLTGLTLTNFPNLDEPDQLAIWRAMERLCKDNPHAAAQLTGLANLKENNPVTWKMGLKILKLPG